MTSDAPLRWNFCAGRHSPTGDYMTTIRESIALKVHAGGAVSLTDAEAADVLKMIDELGQHEKNARDHQREAGNLRSQVAERDNDLRALREFLARERRALWDQFAAAAIASGRETDAAAAIAEQMMIRREARRA